MDTLPYYLVAGLLALAAVLNPTKKPNPVAWGLAFILITVFVGLRHKIGMDWNNYLRMTDVIGSGTLFEGFGRAEPAFVILTWLSAKAGLGVYGVNLVVAVIFASGLFRFCAKTENPWLGLLVAFPMLVMVVACSASRQAAAIGILMWAVAGWRDYGVMRRAMLILLASMFHYSAIFLLCFAALELNVPLRTKVMVFLATVAGTVWLMVATGGGDYYITTYVTEQSDLAYSPGALQHVLLNAIPAAFVLLGRRFRERLLPSALLVNLALFALLLVPVAFVSSLAAGRLTLYLFPVSIFVFAALPGVASAPVSRAIIRTVLASIFVVICWVWLTFSNSGYAYVPYGNALFMHQSELHL